MQLYYDNISGTFTLQCEDGHREFLGPWDYAAGKLMECGLTEIEAREAMLNAFFNRGLAVSLENIKKMARLINRVA
jgi:hypothetical protein